MDYDLDELAIDDLAALRAEQDELLDALNERDPSDETDEEILVGFDTLRAIDAELDERAA